jgi:hypothetical protein
MWFSPTRPGFKSRRGNLFNVVWQTNMSEVVVVVVVDREEKKDVGAKLGLGRVQKKVMTSEGIEPPIFGSGIRRVAIAP